MTENSEINNKLESDNELEINNKLEIDNKPKSDDKVESDNKSESDKHRNSLSRSLSGLIAWVFIGSFLYTILLVGILGISGKKSFSDLEHGVLMIIGMVIIV